jgi:hypothetical protein
MAIQDSNQAKYEQMASEIRGHFSGLDWNIRKGEWQNSTFCVCSNDFGCGCFCIAINYSEKSGFFAEIEIGASGEIIFDKESDNLSEILEALEEYLNQLIGDILSIKKEWD